jgi:type IV secretory pathway VirB10-like protein
MFCTQCGNSIDLGKNFCGNCGAKIPKASPVASEPLTTSADDAPSPTIIESRTQFMSAQTLALDAESSDQAAKGQNGKLIIMIAAAVIIVIAAGAGVYFGTDLLRPTPAPEPVALAPAVPPIAAPPAQPEENAPAPSETKQNDLWEPSPPTPEPPAADQTEQPKPPSPPRVKAAPREEPAPPPRRAARERAQEPGSSSASQTRLSPMAAVYETVRPTVVYAEPSTSSKVVSNIDSNVRLTVVGANNEWLELRSRLGNPPGFVRREHARPLSGNN